MTSAKVVTLRADGSPPGAVSGEDCGADSSLANGVADGDGAGDSVADGDADSVEDGDGDGVGVDSPADAGFTPATKVAKETETAVRNKPIFRWEGTRALS